jgi:hypothetical protein
MKQTCSFVALSIAVLGSTLCAQETNQATPHTGDSIVRELESEIEALDAAYRGKLQAMRSAATTKIATLQKEVAANDLDAAIRLRDLAKKILDQGSEATASDEPAVDTTVKKNDVGSKRDVQQKDLREKIAELEKQLGMQSELSKRIVGTSYRIQIGNDLRVWTFGPNGALLNNGKPTATRWSAFGNDAVICAGYDNGFVDICQFSNDFRNIEVIFVGDYKKSKTHHVGSIMTR